MTLVKYGWRRQRAVVRHVLPADGHRAGLSRHRRRPGFRQGAARRCSRVSCPAGEAEAGDKTMFDALAPALDALDAALASGSGLAAALRRRDRRRRKGPGRNGIDGRAQGPGQLPRAAQRRSPGPGRDVGGDADRGRGDGWLGERVTSCRNRRIGRRLAQPGAGPCRRRAGPGDVARQADSHRGRGGPGRKHVRHRRRADRRRHRRRRSGRRRGGADGPRQRGALGRARAGTARRRRPGPGGAVSRSAGGGTGRRRGARRPVAPARRSRRGSGRRTRRQDRPSRVGTGGGARPTLPATPTS